MTFCLLISFSALYLLNWIYRYFTEESYSHWLVWIAGAVQTALYADFFYYYFKRCIFFDQSILANPVSAACMGRGWCYPPAFESSNDNKNSANQFLVALGSFIRV